MRPAYMTSTRSHTWRTTATSWLMSRMATPLVSRIDLEQLEHLLLDGDVEGGRRLVRDDERRVAHEPHADHRPLAQPARELVGILARAPLGSRHVDGAQAVDGAVVRLPIGSCRGDSGPPRRAARRSCRVGLNEVPGSWNTIDIEVPRRWRWSALGAPQQVGAQEAQPVGGHAAGLLDEPRDGERRERLARARLADHAHRLARADAEGSRPGRVAPAPAPSGSVTVRPSHVEHRLDLAGDRLVGAVGA